MTTYFDVYFKGITGKMVHHHRYLTAIDAIRAARLIHDIDREPTIVETIDTQETL